MDCTVIITANGSGERMKCISPLPKFSLFYKGKRILEHLIDTFPTAKVLTHYEIPYIDQSKIIKCTPTNSRRETLQRFGWLGEVLIVDCDIYLPHPFKMQKSDVDVLFWKHSDNTQTEKIPSGLYFIKDLGMTLSYWNDEIENEIDIALDFATHKEVYLETIHLGTPNEYTNAILGE